MKELPSVLSQPQAWDFPSPTLSADETFQAVGGITTLFVSKARWNAVPCKVTVRLFHILIVYEGTLLHSNVLFGEK